MASATISVPYCTRLWQYYLCAFIFGMGAGAWTTAYNVWLIELWSDKSELVLFVSQLMYGIGASLGPLIDAPYLTGELVVEHHQQQHPVHTMDSSHSYLAYNLTVLDSHQHQLADHVTSLIGITNGERRAKLVTPYVICGSILFICPIILLILFIICRYQTDNNNQNNNQNNNKDIETTITTTTTTTTTKSYNNNNNNNPITSIVDVPDTTIKPFNTCRPLIQLTILALVAMTLACINSLELVYFNFASTYFQCIPLHIPAHNAAIISSALSISYTCSQALNFFIAIKVSTKYMIAYHYVFTLIAMVALAFASHSIVAIWILAIAVGYGFSILFPGILGIAGSQLDICNRRGTMIFFFVGAFNFLPPLILGPYLESMPLIFVILPLALLVLSILGTIVFVILMKKYVYNDNDNDNSNNNCNKVSNCKD
ncbi:uncharacterized protein LOC128953228 [Oppia nitens]|uniref:uncharacterized protein LOC128953228 n=1 Tax=Oppia nitens TaxID=1686743 RepID=UPI0023DCA76A|nr:uncharacterized protein LOC128953228 [Oppia nitens]